jgi:hypothetical protein
MFLDQADRVPFEDADHGVVIVALRQVGAAHRVRDPRERGAHLFGVIESGHVEIGPKRIDVIDAGNRELEQQPRGQPRHQRLKRRNRPRHYPQRLAGHAAA